MDQPEAELMRKDERPSFRKANEPGLSWLIIIVLLVFMAIAIIIFGKPQDTAINTPTGSPLESPTPSMVARIYTVSYDAGVFSPTNLRIHAGDTVRFKNESVFPIRVVSDDIVGFDSIGDVPQGSYFASTFAVRGTFTYYNKHNKDQTGTIIVR
jgi:plastocyanin